MSLRLRWLAVALLLAGAPALAAAGNGFAADCSGLDDPNSFVFAGAAPAAPADLDKAITACTGVIQGLGAPRERAAASINRGALRMGKALADGARYGHAAGADEDFDDAVRLDPKFAYARYARGIGKTWGFSEDPIADFDEALRLDPGFALAFQGRATAFELRRDHDRAIADYTAAIGLDPTLGRSFTGRGAARYESGDAAGAIADLTEAVRLTANDPAYRLRAADVLGSVRFGAGDIGGAIGDYGEAVRIKPDYAYGYFHRGVAQLLLGSLEPARADLRRAADLGPQNAEFAIWLEIADRHSGAKGRLAEARETFDMSQWPAPMVGALLGETASATLIEAAKAGPYSNPVAVCEAQIFTGELALSRGARPEAAEAFEGAVATCPPRLFERDVGAAELRRMQAK